MSVPWLFGAPVLLCALSGSAAPSGADAPAIAPRGFPVVATPGGWARYQVDGNDGPKSMVVRVGKAEADRGEAGRWIVFELEVTGIGRVEVHLLVVGKVFSAQSVRRARVLVAGEAQPEAKWEVPPADGVFERRLVRKGPRKIGNRSLTVEEYEISGGEGVGWSPDVPGVGLVYVQGIEEMQLVAFGVGGDPWFGEGAGKDQESRRNGQSSP